MFGETEGSGGILPVRAVAGSDLSTSGCKRGISSLHTCLRVCGFCGTDGFKYMGEMVSVLWSCCCRPRGMQYHVMKKTVQQNGA